MVRIISKIAVVLVGGIAMLFLGIAYPLAAWQLVGEREPWVTLLLGIGLAITVFGVGHIVRVPVSGSGIIYAGGVALMLLVRWIRGRNGWRIEFFGAIHLACLLATQIAMTMARIRALR